MDRFSEYGTDFYWLVRDGEPTYLLDLDYDNQGLCVCDCEDFSNRKRRYAERGILIECKHLRKLKEQLKKERE